jgi:hypothetical protein
MNEMLHDLTPSGMLLDVSVLTMKIKLKKRYNIHLILIRVAN